MKTLADRFWQKVRKTDTCWWWTGSLDSGGYGQIRVEGKLRGAHLVSMDLAGKPIPKGMIGDHVWCRNHACVNPAHIQPSTSRANTLSGVGITAMAARRTTCPKGHALEFIRKRRRGCRTCNREWARAGMRRLRARQKETA